MRSDLIDLNAAPVDKARYGTNAAREHKVQLTAEAIERLDMRAAAGLEVKPFGEIECEYSCFIGLQYGFDEMRTQLESFASSEGEFLDWILTPREGEPFGMAILALIDPTDDERVIEWAFQFEKDEPDELRQGSIVTLDVFRHGRVDGRAIDALEAREAVA